MSQKMQPHELLSVFAGRWKTTGRTVDGIDVEATDVYEWLPGGYFLMHQWHAVLGDGMSRGIELLGYDTEKQAYHSRFYDDQGNTDAYDITTEGNTWKFARKTERSTVDVSDDGNTLTVLWEASDDGKEWKPWMNVVLQKEA